ncbi:MAG: hypothetical protein AAFV32_09110 [Myxococcota bacterium]
MSEWLSKRNTKSLTTNSRWSLTLMLGLQFLTIVIGVIGVVLVP